MSFEVTKTETLKAQFKQLSILIKLTFATQLTSTNFNYAPTTIFSRYLTLGTISVDNLAWTL